MLRTTSRTTVLAAAAFAFVLAGCGGAGYSSSPMMAAPVASQVPSGSLTMSTSRVAATTVDTDNLSTDVDPPDGPSILAQLNTATTIGSTIDPITGDQNPYGLDIAPADSGLIHRGDLVVCNFNDSANVQGTGNAIVALAPQPGSSPRPIAHNGALLGCTENVQTNDGTLWVTAFTAPDVEVLSPSGGVLKTLTGSPFTAPFGITIAQNSGLRGDPVLYEGDASTGDIVRVQAGRNGVQSDVIATGFAVNHGVPGTELGPGGLQYEPNHDRLYIVDGTNNTLYELRHVSTIPANGIAVGADGTSFSGPFARRARVVFSGNPLNAPISSALFSNGNIAIGNTGNPNGENLMVEITPHGKVAYVRNVDNGASGAIFGMATALTYSRNSDDVELYFNDDNDNAVIELSK